MLASIFIPFFTILVAELFDKSQVAILLLSTKTHRLLHVFFGAMLAFLLVDGAAILFGAWIAEMIPLLYIKTASGLLFIAFGLLSLRHHKSQTKQISVKKNVFASSFLLITVSEFGDKTQLASAVFATNYPLMYVAIGVFSALFILVVLAILLGKFLANIIKPQSLTLAS